MKLIKLNLIVIFAILLTLSACSKKPLKAENLSKYVNPFIGTSEKSNGNTIPGAAAPFGMVQLTPATNKFNDISNTYTWDKDSITGFVSTILSGTGGACFGDGLFMPWYGKISKSPGTNWYSYSSKFSHENETAKPGYYSVMLHNGKLKTELSATTRSGMAMFTATDTGEVNILINPSIDKNQRVFESSIELKDNDKVFGSTQSGHFWNDKSEYTVYFVMVFDRPFSGFGTWNENEITKGANKTSGKNSGAYVSFTNAKDKPVKFKIGISYVSQQNALANLMAENPGWDFEDIINSTENQWNTLLNRVKVKGNDEKRLTTFYTALYHTFYQPSVFSDVNGDYIGFDNKIHNTRKKYIHYTNFSGWDVYRNQIPLMAMIVPEVTNDFAISMVNNANQVGAFPKWSVANDESGVMIGDPATAALASIYAFGVRDFDYKKAYEYMLKAATVPGVFCNKFEVRPNLKQYLELGYIPEDNHKDRSSVSMSQEYCIADYALSQMASDLGDQQNAEKLLKQSQLWTRYYNKEKGYLWPVMTDGSFMKNFNPHAPSYSEEIGFCEENADTYLWMIPHDYKRLFELMGGTDTVIKRLDAHDYQDLQNEPAYMTPWVYNYTGTPYKTQKTVRDILLRLYTSDKNGLPGNDDLGQMSAWCASSCMGLFPAIPGTDLMLISSPLFPSITIDNGRDKKIVIEAPNASDTNLYIAGVTLDGVKYDKPWISWSKLKNGSKVKFILQSTPDKNWGSKPENASPSFESLKK